MALATSDLRKALFGRSDRTSAYLIQSWTEREGRPQVWRGRVAYSLAGANRIASSRWLTGDIRGPEVWVTILRVEEVNTLQHPTPKPERR